MILFAIADGESILFFNAKIIEGITQHSSTMERTQTRFQQLLNYIIIFNFDCSR